jgi:hypothetical protein
VKTAWRGVVDKDGDVWAWPMLLWDHNDAFGTLPVLKKHRARWRQWDHGGRIDFEPGASDEDKAKVEAWVKAAS